MRFLDAEFVKGFIRVANDGWEQGWHERNGKHRVIYHAHTTNVIALTFVLPLKDEIFTRELWEMATECPVVFRT